MTGSIHKMISKNAGQNAKGAVEGMSAAEFPRREKITERTFIADFMELEFSLPRTSIEKQIGHCRTGGYRYEGKVT